MTEESMSNKEDLQEFGTHMGCVIRFFNRKGYGFIRDLNDEKDYFIHNTEIRCREYIYRKLYPGEYVSYNLMEREGREVCTDVRGIMGYPLLVENEEHTYRVFPKSDRRMFDRDDTSTSDSDSDSDCIHDSDDSTLDKSSVDNPSVDNPSVKEPMADNSSADNPSADNPSADNSSVKEPMADRPMVDDTNTDDKEFINKEAPEGIEVAEFDGLNINEEMS